MKEKKTFYNVLVQCHDSPSAWPRLTLAQVVLVASIGSLSYGYCLGILSNVTGNPDFLKTVNIDPTSSYGNSMMSVFFCLLFIGALIGCTMYAWIARRFGRRVGIAVGEAFIIFGGALQAGLVNSVMLCWGRIFTGMGIGIVLGAVPLYQAEVSPPHGRGLMVGLHGMCARNLSMQFATDDGLTQVLCWASASPLRSGSAWAASTWRAPPDGESPWPCRFPSRCPWSA
jgi:MFS family permease